MMGVRTFDNAFEAGKVARNMLKGYERLKGLKDGNCNRAACQRPLAGQPQSSMIDHETFTNGRLYYCEECTEQFNKSDREFAGGQYRCTWEPTQ